MRWQHIVLGILVTAIWGFNFVVLKVALVGVPPLLLTAVRFILACLPVLFLPRPKGMSWKALLIVGATSFLGQYVFLFVAIGPGAGREHNEQNGYNRDGGALPYSRGDGGKSEKGCPSP